MQDSYRPSTAKAVFNRFINVVATAPANKWTGFQPVVNEDVLEREQIRAWLQFEDVAPSGRVQIPAINALDWGVFLKSVMTYVLVEYPSEKLHRNNVHPNSPIMVKLPKRAEVVLDETDPSSPYLKPTMQ